MTASAASPPGRLSAHLEPLLAQIASLVTLSAGPHRQLTVRTPFTGAILGNIPAGGEADVETAVSLARAAQPAWAARPLAERAAIFLRFHDLLLERQDEVLDLIQLETGKARRHAFEEILDTAGVCRYYARHARHLLRARRRRGAMPGLTRTWEIHAPIGVVGFITPWNYPLILALTDAVPALIAGNAAVLKPDHQTTLTALRALSLLREAGLPAEVCPLVPGEGPVAGPALIERADFIMYTGSTRTGRLVARQAAERLIPHSLELGGKNPMIVFADAGLEGAVEGALRGCFVGAGQVCVSIERLYVERPVLERFSGRFVERTRALRLGAALDYSVDVGSLTSERQLQTVEEHVRDALEKGAVLLAGGRRRPDLGPLFYEPTILAGVREEMLVHVQETFGPVVSLYPFDTEDEAVALANATPYGLNASVWTRDSARGLRVARRIRAGSVNVNEAYAAAWGSSDSPQGGMKESGVGRRHGAEGILKYTETQTVAVQRLLPIAPPRGMNPATWARWMTRLLKITRHAGPLG